MAIDSIRVRADLSDFVTDSSRFRWMHLAFSDFVKIGDLMDHIRSEYFGPDALHELELFLDETPFCLPSWESIRILRDGDIVKAKLRAKKRKTRDSGEDGRAKKKKQISCKEAKEPKEPEAPSSEMTEHKTRKKKQLREKAVAALQTLEDHEESLSSSASVDQPNGNAETVDQEEPTMDDDAKLLETGPTKRKRKRKRKPRNRNLLPPDTQTSGFTEEIDSAFIPDSAEKPDTPEDTSEDETESVLPKGDTNVAATNPTSSALPRPQTNGTGSHGNAKPTTFESSFRVVSCEEALLGSSWASGSRSLPRSTSSRSSSSSSPALKSPGDFSRLLQLAQRPVVVTREKRAASVVQTASAASTASAALPASAASQPRSGSQPHSVSQPTSASQLPKPGQRITFRVMEIRDDYTPGLSEPYVGEVVEASTAGLVINVRKRRRVGKFELLQHYGQEEEGPDGDEEVVETVSHAWSELVEAMMLVEGAVQ